MWLTDAELAWRVWTVLEIVEYRWTVLDVIAQPEALLDDVMAIAAAAARVRKTLKE